MSSEAASTPQRTVQRGSFVLIDYVIKIKDTDELIDTTIEEEAKKAGVTDVSRIYEPRLSVVGKGFLLRAIEEGLIGMQVGDHRKFEVPPDRAFGNRDPTKVRVYPLRRFKDVDQPLRVGSKIVIEGREGIVRSIGSGRVQIDFNHQLADKTLTCDVWVREVLEDRESKAYHLLHDKIPEVTKENTTIEEEGGVIKIKLPKDVYLISGLQVIKRVVSKELLDSLEGVERVTFIEEYEKESSPPA
ncbi:MAG: peptidylprolyl isomerase [Aigarchaeota archaeon]|nr:peptidylprolyl isomerase [Aigarchaeota archaeon]MDW8093000.1 FKBP-type peptidyl-prolyl cis-trans isomerase [Nitrososphaerota archaeon]